MPLGSNVIEFTIKGTDRFSGPMGKVGKALGGAIRITAKFAAGAAAAGTAVGFFANRMAKGEDRAAKFGRRIGVVVDELTTYQHVADVAGIKQETFNMAIQRMTRRVSEAAEGTGEARAAVAELGLEARNFAQLPLGEKLQLLSDRMEGVSSQSDRVRLAFKLFDSEGVAMLQMLEGGSERMQQLAEDARMLGATIDRQAAANAEQFTTQTSRLTAAIGGASRAIADEWIPILAGLAKHAADVIGSMRGELETWARRSMRAFIAMGVVAEKIFSKIFGDAKNIWQSEGWMGFARRAFDALQAILQAFGDFLPTLGKLALNTYKVIWTSYIELGKWAFRTIYEVFIKGFPTLVKAVGQMFKIMFEGIVEVGRWAWQKIKGVFTGEEGPTLGELMFQRLPEATEAARENLASSWASISAEAPDLAQVLFQRIPEQTARSRAQVAEQFAALTNQLRTKATQFSNAFASHFGITAESINERVDQIIARFELFGEQTRETQRDVRETGTTYAKEVRKLAEQQLIELGPMSRQMAKVTLDAVNQMSSGVADVFVEVATEGGKLFSSLKSLAKQLIKDIARAIAKAIILRGILASMGGGGGGLLGSAVGGVFHSGVRYVPQEGTYLLDKGERVLSRQENEDLTRLLSRGGSLDRGAGGGGSVTIQNLTLHVLENATNADALLAMPPEDMREVVARKILPAFDRLGIGGVKTRTDEIGG